MWVWSLGWKDPLEKGIATHFSILAWRMPWTEQPKGLQSIGLHRVRNDWSDVAHSTNIGNLRGASPVALVVKNPLPHHPPANARDIRDSVWFLGQEDPQKEGMTIHSILAWRIPWTEEPRSPVTVGCDWSDLTCTQAQVICMVWFQ